MVICTDQFCLASYSVRGRCYNGKGKGGFSALRVANFPFTDSLGRNRKLSIQTQVTRPQSHPSTLGRQEKLISEWVFSP